MVYVVNNGSNSFTPIIIVTNTAGTAISVGSGPNGIAITPNGQTVYVSNSGDSDVTPIATSSNTAGVTIPVASDPQAIAITPSGQTAYVDSYFVGVTPITTASQQQRWPLGHGHPEPRGDYFGGGRT